MFFHLGETRFVTKNHIIFKNVTFLSLLIILGKTHLTVHISKRVMLVIFTIFGHERSFPPRKLILGTIIKAETDSTGPKKTKNEIP